MNARELDDHLEQRLDMQGIARPGGTSLSNKHTVENRAFLDRMKIEGPPRRFRGMPPAYPCARCGWECACGEDCHS